MTLSALALSALALSAPALADEASPAPTFHPLVQVRPRFEYSTGKDGASGGELMFVTQRARLGITAKLPKLSARVLVQDVRMWGSEASTLLDFTADAFDLHEGWAQYKPTDAVALRVGRQEITAHEHRLLGNVDWTQQGRSFDAATLKLTGEKLSADAGFAVLADENSGVVTTNGLMGFVRGGIAPAKGAVVDVLAIVDTDETLDRTRATAGLYAKGGSGILSGRVEAYGQVGSVGDLSIQAGMVGVQGTLAPEASFKPEITLWYDLLSGDGDAADDALNAFDTLYATNHKFYGQIDIMTFLMGGALDGQGLHDAALKLSAKPVEALAVNLDAHVFAAAAPATEDTMLGQEADLWLSGKVSGALSLQGGASMFLYAADKDPDAWGWAQMNLEI